MGKAMDNRLSLVIKNATQVLRVSDDGDGPRRGKQQSRLDVVERGAVAVRDGKILDVGPTADIERKYDLCGVKVIDATGQVVLPGLVDSHTHPIFGGVRCDEYARRLGGLSLKETSARGGGIWRTVVETRDASDDELMVTIRSAFADMLKSGTVTVEAKSGYGQTVAQELRLLELIRRASQETVLNVVPTCLGVHMVPREMASADAYVDLVIEEMLPAVAEQGIARFCDVTCEKGWFTSEQCLRVLGKSQSLGLKSKLHIDAFAPAGGWRTATQVGAVCADHVTFTPDEEIEAVGPTKTVAVLLPTAELYYFSERRANARKLIETDVPVSVSTDFCSSIHTPSLLQTLPLGAAWFRMTPEEMIVAATLNGAYATGMAETTGSLDPGKRADIIVVDVSDYRMMVYDMGVSRLAHVISAGNVVSGATP